MGWKPREFYETTIDDIQVALAAHYDRVEFERIEKQSVLRRLAYCIINTNGFQDKEVEAWQILELPHEREQRLREEAKNKYSDEEVKKRIERWAKEGPGLSGKKTDAARVLTMVAK